MSDRPPLTVIGPARPPARPPGAPEKPGVRRSSRAWIWIKAVVWVLALAPLAVLVWDAATGNLQAEPVKDITHRTGWWTLALLLATLAVTPVRYVTGWKQVVRLRRPIGLFAFFYACLHVLTYFGLDQFFSFRYIVEDVVERPYITVGFTAWLLLIPLAVTSTRGWMRRLGGRWQTLHRLVYAAAALGTLHFFWLVKADTREPLVFAAVLAGLLAFRLPFVRRWFGRRKGQPDRPVRRANGVGGRAPR